MLNQLLQAIRDAFGTKDQANTEAGIIKIISTMSTEDLDIDYNDLNFFDSPIHLAASYGFGSVVTALLRLNYNLASAQTKDGSTALHEAAAGNHVEVAKILLKHDNDLINTKNNRGDIPLHYAASYGRKAAVLFLLEYDISTVNHTNEFGKKPIDYIDFYKYQEIAQLLTKAAKYDAKTISYIVSLSTADDAKILGEDRKLKVMEYDEQLGLMLCRKFNQYKSSSSDQASWLKYKKQIVNRTFKYVKISFEQVVKLDEALDAVKVEVKSEITNDNNNTDSTTYFDEHTISITHNYLPPISSETKEVIITEIGKDSELVF